MNVGAPIRLAWIAETGADLGAVNRCGGFLALGGSATLIVLARSGNPFVIV